MSRRLKSSSGNTVLEFTLVGIPLIFVLISIFEIARGMWIYHTLAYAIKEGTRYAVVHGQDCATTPNTCAVTIGQISARIRDSGVGLIPTDFQNITFNSVTRSITCATLDDCINGPNAATYWPSAGPPPATPDAGGVRGMDIWISGQYPFQSAIALFWPGAQGGILFPTFNLPGYSRERIQY